MREFARPARLEWPRRGFAAATFRRLCLCLTGLAVLLAVRVPAAAQATPAARARS
jgi:hypothetical protein